MMDDYEKRARRYYDRKVARAEETLIYVIGLIALFAVLLLLSLLTGCSSQERELVYDSDQCLAQDKRAVMLCTKYVDRCYIECRDKHDE